MFWSGIWSESKEHKINAEWLKKMKEENNFQKQECLVITKQMISEGISLIEKLHDEMEFRVSELRN